MGKLVLDSDLQTRLNGLDEPIEFCDASGKILGHFFPVELSQRVLYSIAEQCCPYSEQELTEFQQGADGRSLAEIWKSLGQV